MIAIIERTALLENPLNNCSDLSSGEIPGIKPIAPMSSIMNMAETSIRNNSDTNKNIARPTIASATAISIVKRLGAAIGVQYVI